MTNAKLKLNPSKTEILLIGTKQQQQKHFLSLFPNSNLDHNTSPASSAHNIGVTFYSELKFDHHIRQICKFCFYHFRDLRRIRRHLSIDTAKMIANSLITSRLNYCNSLLFNIDDKYIHKNTYIQVVCKTSKFCYITPVLHLLHWLRIKYRIDFKINTWVYKTLHTNQPVYLRELLSLSEKQRTHAARILFDLTLLKPRLVLVLSLLLLHTCGIPFMQKYEQLRRIKCSAKIKDTSLHLVFHPNSLTSCCSDSDDFD